MIEDRILVMRCKRKSRGAFSQIYEKYRDQLLILGIALSNNEALAEDALHDTFVRFAEGMKSFVLKGSLKGYLSVCMTNRIRDLQRSGKSKKAVSLDEAIDCEANVQAPGVRIELNEELGLLAKALEQIPADQREVIGLRIYGQMRFGQIARAKDISVNTIKGQYRYGITKLRSILKDKVML